MAHLFVPVASRKQSSIALLYLHWFSASTAIRVLTPGNVTVRTGAEAILSCMIDGDGSVVQAEWSRCGQNRFLVVHIDSGMRAEPPYRDRITDVTISGFTIKDTNVSDSGDYCCTLTTFPHGTLRNQLHLLIHPPDAQESPTTPMTAPILCGVLGAVLLAGLIGVTFHRRRRRGVQNPIHVVIHSGPSFSKKILASPSPSPNASPRQSQHNGQDSNHSEGDVYFNVLKK